MPAEYGGLVCLYYSSGFTSPGFSVKMRACGRVVLFLDVGLIGGEKKSTETAVLAASTMLQSNILVTFPKGIFGRQPPFRANGVDHWSESFSRGLDQGSRGDTILSPGDTGRGKRIKKVLLALYECENGLKREKGSNYLLVRPLNKTA